MIPHGEESTTCRERSQPVNPIKDCPICRRKLLFDAQVFEDATTEYICRQCGTYRLAPKILDALNNLGEDAVLLIEHLFDRRYEMLLAEGGIGSLTSDGLRWYVDTGLDTESDGHCYVFTVTQDTIDDIYAALSPRRDEGDQILQPESAFQIPIIRIELTS